MEQAVFLILVNVSEEDWSYKIDEQRKIVGRSATAGIRIPDHFRQVSRQHAEVWREKNRIWLRDLGSRGGTAVNSISLEKEQPVNVTVGDRITLTDVELTVVGNVSKLAKVMVEAGIAVLTSAAEEAASATDIKRFLPVDIVRDMLRRLTPAELDIVLWMCRGYTADEELGRTLNRSPNTIRTQVSSIFDKLNVHSRAKIVTWLKQSNGAFPPAVKSERRTAFDTKTL
jgi:DNA-binding CsgD family transcriptional regulator